MAARSGRFPAALKHALVTPLLKKPGLDPDDLANYRPVSNLPFLGKLIERAVHQQLMDHLADNHLLPPRQSAYRPNHSTETALLSIYNDLLLAADQNNASALLLLDLSAAFDTLDHQILLARLANHCGIRGTANDWFRSFLADRTQSVCLNGCSSARVLVPSGVPQGSVLGGPLFIILTSTLVPETAECGVTVDQFSDDTQARSSFPLNSDGQGQRDALTRLGSWALKADAWFLQNRVKFNLPKSSLIITCPKNSTAPPADVPLQVGGAMVHPSAEAKNLGVIFDQHLTTDAHIRHVCKAASYHLWRIGRVRGFLDVSTTKCLVNSLVLSRIDYANSLFTGLPNELLSRLQRIINYAARLTCRVKRFSSITPHLKSLSWLPVNQRISFKLATLTFKCIHGLAPKHLPTYPN